MAVTTIGDRVMADRIASLDGITSFRTTGPVVGTRSSLPFLRNVVLDHKGERLGGLKSVGNSEFLDRDG